MGSGEWSFARMIACRTRSRSCLRRRQVVTSSFAESVDPLTGDRGGQEVGRSLLVLAEPQDGQAALFCARRSDDTEASSTRFGTSSIRPKHNAEIASSLPARMRHRQNPRDLSSAKCGAVVANLGHAKFHHNRLMGVVNPFRVDPARYLMPKAKVLTALGSSSVVYWPPESRQP